jgi:hypothetical protein
VGNLSAAEQEELRASVDLLRRLAES